MTTIANTILSKGNSVPRVNRKLKRGLPQPNGNPLKLMQQILNEDLFLGMLCLERKRAERSTNKFLLVLLDAHDLLKTKSRAEAVKGLVQAVNTSRRETDLAGWYQQDAILGIIFSDLQAFTQDGTIEKMLLKLHEGLVANLQPEQVSKVHVSAHIFADDSDDEDKSGPADSTFYPDLQHRDDSRRFELHLKRVMDIVGSLFALLLFAPVFIPIAIIIKLTSEGPIFFSQERLGQFGKIFTCLKFRTMFANNDPKIHQEFMKKVIKGEHDGKSSDGSQPVYKMTNDPRITRIGHFIRKTSLDELPQFLNVLRGEMSLVGPRPPLAYEFEEYDIWHRRRVLEVKPGITGLWQVKGRSRVCFEDMVRLDLNYARGWSLWTDLRILLETPGAVIFGKDAY